MLSYDQLVSRRREFCIPGYVTLAEVGFDWPLITPYQKAARSDSGPVLIGLHWIGAGSIEPNRAELEACGYLPKMGFNRVLNIALYKAGMVRKNLYITQAFHLLPHRRSENIPMPYVDASFDAITRHELIGRRVIALGNDAADACLRHGIKFIRVPHPAARGLTYEEKGRRLGQALSDARKLGA